MGRRLADVWWLQCMCAGASDTDNLMCLGEGFHQIRAVSFIGGEAAGDAVARLLRSMLQGQ